jgi:hypothetical protein
MCISANTSPACNSLIPLVAPLQEHGVTTATAAGDGATGSSAAATTAGPVVTWFLQQLLHALPAADSPTAHRSVQLLDTLCWLVAHSASTTSSSDSSAVSTTSLAADLARRLLAHPCQDSSTATATAAGAAAASASRADTGDVMFVGLANAVVAALQAEPASKHQLGQPLLRALCTELLFATSSSSSSTSSSSAALVGDEPACRAAATRAAAFKLVQVRSEVASYSWHTFITSSFRVYGRDMPRHSCS